MDINISGKIIKVLEPLTGQGKNGEWKKQEFVIQTDGPYPKNVCFTIWNNKIEPELLEVDKKVTVSFSPESREYNGRWYTDLTAWRIQLNDTNNQVTEGSDFIENQEDIVPDNSIDDLPF